MHATNYIGSTSTVPVMQRANVCENVDAFGSTNYVGIISLVQLAPRRQCKEWSNAIWVMTIDSLTLSVLLLNRILTSLVGRS